MASMCSVKLNCIQPLSSFVLKPRCQPNKMTKKMHAVPREIGYAYHQFPKWLKFRGNLDFLKGKS
ncbi:hypothetical protein NC653_028743 [Populus alba x Populus x berolinensis]|uniref:Uncharacterized protein n=1 Tax=Populus alba x Populus x berolinensis TaxID=444605 RepID=A0AAD6Q4G0_9ROSI|nr:hypothetical protein NC653_028743 [Populus alba x Populus x berolinensis]